MLELSLHILDIVNNSIKANATNIEIEINEQISKNILFISITDNGCGMDEDFLCDAIDPFKTARTTGKVGMGLSMFKAAAKATGGNLEISSQKNVGTKVVATFTYNHIDRQPIGNMAETMLALMCSNENINFIYRHIIGDKEFLLDTKRIRNILGDISFSEPDITLWVRDYIKEGLNEIRKGVQR